LKHLFILLFGFAMISSSAYTQVKIAKFSYGLGGDVFFVSRSGDSEGSVLSLNPQVDFFLQDNFSMGVDVAFQRNSSDGRSSWNLGIGPSLRYYISTNNVLPFVGIGYSWGTSGISDSDIDTNSSVFSASAGFLSFLTRSVALEPLVRYSRSSNTSKISTSDGIQEFEFNVSQIYVGIGLKILIRKEE